VHGYACLCVFLRVRGRVAKGPGKHKPHRRKRARGIISFDLSNQEAKFFICTPPVQNGAIETVLDGYLMNLNFAFACMIVVSFTIALVHT